MDFAVSTGRAQARVPLSSAYLDLSAPDFKEWFGAVPHLGVDGDYFGPGSGETDAAGGTDPTVSDLWLIGPFENNAPEFTFWEGHSADPGLLVSPFGGGRVSWLPWRIGALYQMHGIPEYVTLLGHLLDRRIGKPPLRTDAPGAVEFTVYAHPRGIVVHAINDAAAQRGAFVEVTPLAGFEVRIASEARRARRLDGGAVVDVTRDGEEVCFRIERLESFAAVVLEET